MRVARRGIRWVSALPAAFFLLARWRGLICFNSSVGFRKQCAGVIFCGSAMMASILMDE